MRSLPMTLFSMTLGMGLFISPIAAQDTEMPQRMGLWQGKAPIGNGQFEEAEVWMTVYQPPKPTQTAVVICPGGGYAGHAVQPEGHGIAKWLNSHGVAGMVVEYRLPKGRWQVPLLDAQQAIRTVRANAKSWNIHPDRIGIIGFSAGGHLASTAATHFDNGNSNGSTDIEKASCRPDFAILIYPVITMGEKTHAGSKKNLLGNEPAAELINQYSNEKQVTSQTPPTFLAHPIDDKTVPVENSRMFADAMKMNGAKVNYLELPYGGHGLNGYKGPMWDAWQEQSITWLKEIGLIVPTAAQ